MPFVAVPRLFLVERPKGQLLALRLREPRFELPDLRLRLAQELQRLARGRARLARLASDIAQPARELCLRAADALARIEPGQCRQPRREDHRDEGQKRKPRALDGSFLHRLVHRESYLAGRKYATRRSSISSSLAPPTFASLRPRRLASAATRGCGTKSGVFPRCSRPAAPSISRRFSRPSAEDTVTACTAPSAKAVRSGPLSVCGRTRR